MSSKVKLTQSGDVALGPHGAAVQAVVALGTALVLVTFVTPMATVPQTALDLGAGSAGRAWILSSMSVGLAATLLITGAVGDAVGRRRTYVAGLFFLAVGSLVCAAAPASAVFVAGRVLEGLGGAAILACGLAILAHTFVDPTERARATGVWGASVGIGITAGALLAAGLDIGTGWREAYLVVGLVALALVVPSMRLLGESSAAHPRRLDVPGVLSLAASLSLLVSGLTQARSGLSAPVVVVLGLALALLVVFGAVEARSREPMLDPALLLVPGFLAATLGALVVGLGIIGMSSNVPFLVQAGLGGSLWVATWVALGWSATGVLTSLLVRRVRIPLSGPQLVSAALAVIGVGQLLALGVQPSSSPWRVLPSMVLTGLATGVLNVALGREAVATVPPDRAAMGSGTNNTARYLGAACGITLFTVLMTHAGGGSGPSELVDGWSTAVLVSSLVSLAGAAAIAVIAAHSAIRLNRDRSLAHES